MPTKEAIAPTPSQQTAPPVTQIKDIPVRVVATRPAKAGEAPPATKIESPSAVAPKPEDPGAPVESVGLSTQLSAIARKEQAFRQRERTQAEREKNFEAVLANAKKFEETQEAIKTKNFAKLEELGLQYDDYLKFKLESPGQEDPAAKEFKEIRGELAKMKQEKEEESEREFEETNKAYRSEIAKAIDTNADFSSLKELKAKGEVTEEHVLKLIHDTWNEDDIQLTVDEACKQVEDFFVEKGKIYSALPKLKPAEPPERKLPPPRRVSTLTNDMSPASPARPNVPLHKLSEGERIAEARRRIEARKQAQGN